MFSNTKNAPERIGGFSLIEVLITSAIIGIVTAIVVVKYGAFNSTVLLRNQAFELGLAIREAQVFSVSVRRESSGFREPYGIHVSLASPQQYILFADSVTENGRYDSGEEVETFTLDSRFRITELCLGSDSSNPGCGKNGLSVSFKRPDFDARLRDNEDGSGQRAVIQLEGVNDNSISRSVVVRSTGLISVE